MINTLEIAENMVIDSFNKMKAKVVAKIGFKNTSEAALEISTCFTPIKNKTSAKLEKIIPKVMTQIHVPRL